MKYTFKELIDVPVLQALTDELYAVASIPSAIVTMDGEILTGSGWQKICTDFHRKHPQIEKECIESDTTIRRELDSGEPFVIYKCPRGLVDASSPIIIAGEHVANVFSGQVFLESRDETTERFFREQARKFGFDEAEYIKAFKEVPIFKEKKFRAGISFLAKLAQTIANNGLMRLRELEAMETLRESEEKYRRIIEGATDVIFTTDYHGYCTYVNTPGQKLTGYTMDELVGMHFTELIPVDWREQVQLRYIKQFQDRGKESRMEFPIITKAGEEKWVDQIVTILAEGDRITGFQSIVRDTSDRKQAEDALRESEEKYRSILESIEEGYFEVDLSGNLTFFNDELCKIFGYSKDELTGMSNRQYTDEENAKKLYQTFNKIYTTGKPDKGFGWGIIRKNGTKILVEASISLRRDPEGKPIGFRGVVRDISEKKELETQLQHAQKMEAIGTLAGGVAHDLNNILGGLVSYPELLLLQLPENSPLRKSILTIQKSGEKAAAVVQDLLTLARRGVVVTDVVDLNDVISEYLKSPEHENLQSYHPGVHVETRLGKDTLNILGSSTHLSKTVMNLVSNAAEAMPEGGALTVSTENRYIDRLIRGYDDVKEGDYVVLSVSDTGTGISSDDIGKIFEPFYTKKKMGRSGTGLGMAVVWGTVKDHNGYIDVQTTEGKGTTFTLYLPITRKKLPEDKSPLTIESYSGNGESILIVDDVEEQRQIASGMLEELGYSVVSVSSGEEAVEYLRTNKADLLVLDMIMDPGMDGLDTYKKILEIHPGQKAIIASGFSETDRVKETLALGARAYIRKPFLLEKIGLAVKKELGK